MSRMLDFLHVCKPTMIQPIITHHLPWATETVLWCCKADGGSHQHWVCSKETTRPDTRSREKTSHLYFSTNTFRHFLLLNIFKIKSFSYHNNRSTEVQQPVLEGETSSQVHVKVSFPPTVHLRHMSTNIKNINAWKENVLLFWGLKVCYYISLWFIQMSCC